MKRTFLLALLVAVACSPRSRYADGDADAKQQEPGPKDKKLVEFDLSEGVSEASASAFIQLPATRTYTGLVRSLERTADDANVSGVYVQLGNPAIDFARASEIGGLLGRIRSKRLPVVCHAHDYGNSAALLALRGCSSIWLSAAGSVDTVGIAAELVHLKGLLDRVKVRADILHVGTYKSGAEPLTREEPSSATIESLTSTLASIRQSWLDLADQGRPGKGVREKLEAGPYTPEAAKAIGLVDDIGFESDAKAHARKLAKTTFQQTAFGPRAKSGDNLDIAELLRLISGADESTGGRPRIAVVPAEGAIGMEAGGPLDSGGISAKSLNKTLRRLKRDDSVKAVVLRIDSPGGSPLASDLVWHELMELRKKKPVVASVGSMAASGGYYIACAAQKVIAEPSSIVGSIGVFGGKIVLGEALREVGVNTFAIPASPAPGAAERAAYLSPFLPWDEATRSRVLGHMQSIYDLFVARVADARKLPVESVRSHAEGRIWSGTQGKERGLVDELGGLARALEVVRKLGDLPRDTPVSVEGQREGLLEMLLLGENADESRLRAAIARLERERALLNELPASVQSAVSALAPLAKGEHVVAALPIAFTLR